MWQDKLGNKLCFCPLEQHLENKICWCIYKQSGNQWCKVERAHTVAQISPSLYSMVSSVFCVAEILLLCCEILAAVIPICVV